MDLAWFIDLFTGPQVPAPFLRLNRVDDNGPSTASVTIMRRSFAQGFAVFLAPPQTNPIPMFTT